MSDTRTLSMEVLNSTKKLQNLLAAHDRAVHQIILLNQKIFILTKQALLHVMDGNKDRALRLMDRKIIAQGIRHMYRQFRLKKWYESQLLVSEIIQTLRPNDTRRPVQEPYEPDENFEDDVQGYVHTVTVVNCNFYRSG